MVARKGQQQSRQDLQRVVADRRLGAAHHRLLTF
jgi:hypothetical protein